MSCTMYVCVGVLECGCGPVGVMECGCGGVGLLECGREAMCEAMCCRAVDLSGEVDCQQVK